MKALNDPTFCIPNCNIFVKVKPPYITQSTVVSLEHETNNCRCLNLRNFIILSTLMDGCMIQVDTSNLLSGTAWPWLFCGRITSPGKPENVVDPWPILRIGPQTK